MSGNILVVDDEKELADVLELYLVSDGYAVHKCFLFGREVQLTPLEFSVLYFEDISRGMDALLKDMQGEISLPPELLSIERKMNQAKRASDRQKSDMLLAEQKKNDLVIYLAHDLKTPLASSSSYLNLLRDEKQLSEELREKYLSIGLAKSEQLEDLINEFLEIARYSLSTITLQYSEINLTRLLKQLVYELQPVLDQKGLTCRLAAGDGILLNCDAGKMQRGRAGSRHRQADRRAP